MQDVLTVVWFAVKIMEFNELRISLSTCTCVLLVTWRGWRKDTLPVSEKLGSEIRIYGRPLQRKEKMAIFYYGDYGGGAP